MVAVSGRLRRAARWLLIVSALVVVLSGAATVASAADPYASPAPLAGPVDPRSNGEGPGLEAEPLLVLVAVVLLGAAAAGGTLLWARLTRDD